MLAKFLASGDRFGVACGCGSRELGLELRHGSVELRRLLRGGWFGGRRRHQQRVQGAIIVLIFRGLLNFGDFRFHGGGGAGRLRVGWGLRLGLLQSGINQRSFFGSFAATGRQNDRQRK